MSNLMELKLETLDGETYEVSAVFADLIRYDVIRAKLNFPTREQSEFLFMGLVAFCALVRTGQLKTDEKPADWMNTIASIEPVETEGDDGEI